MALVLDRALGAPTPLARAAGTLAVRRIMLTDFRSYARLRVELDERPVVLTGANGAGKTNLLEAVSLLAPGRGLRGARLPELDRAEGGAFAVAARLQGPEGPVEVGTGRAQEGARERRLVRIDGSAAPTQAALAEVVSVVWLTPAMDRLFMEGADARRRFLDRLVLADDPGHAAQTAHYHHALRERGRLLREGRVDPSWLGAIEGRAAAAGVAIAAARRQTVAGLMAALAKDPSRFPRPSLELEGEVERWLDSLSALDTETRLAEALAASRVVDAESGTTASGPHRTDLAVRDAMTGTPARDGSTGQQKALLVSIVLAEARRRAAEGGRLPLLLLDEVAAHLDPERRRHLFDEILGTRAQAWLAGTDAALFAPLGAAAQFFNVRASTLHPHDPTTADFSR